MLTKSLKKIALYALLLAAVPAFAHTKPLTFAPAADSTVDPAPTTIKIDFNNPMEPKFSSITLSDSTGHVVNKELTVVSSDAKTMTLALPALVPGVYTVTWVAVSTDTHRSTGEYKFTVAGVPPPPVQHAH